MPRTVIRNTVRLPRGSGRLDFQPVMGGKKTPEHGIFKLVPTSAYRGMIAVETPDCCGLETRARRLARSPEVLGDTGRMTQPDGVVMSPERASRFADLYLAGYDACPVTGEIFRACGHAA